MERRAFDRGTELWSIARKMRCSSCGRKGVIARIGRVRMGARQP